MENGKHFNFRIWHVCDLTKLVTAMRHGRALSTFNNFKVELYFELILNLFEIIQVSIIQETEIHLTG